MNDNITQCRELWWKMPHTDPELRLVIQACGVDFGKKTLFSTPVFSTRVESSGGRAGRACNLSWRDQKYTKTRYMRHGERRHRTDNQWGSLRKRRVTEASAHE